jgi:hypothetical protein
MTCSTKAGSYPGSRNRGCHARADVAQGALEAAVTDGRAISVANPTSLSEAIALAQISFAEPSCAVYLQPDSPIGA